MKFIKLKIKFTTTNQSLWKTFSLNVFLPLRASFPPRDQDCPQKSPEDHDDDDDDDGGDDNDDDIDDEDDDDYEEDGDNDDDDPHALPGIKFFPKSHLQCNVIKFFSMYQCIHGLDMKG